MTEIFSDPTATIVRHDSGAVQASVGNDGALTVAVITRGKQQTVQLVIQDENGADCAECGAGTSSVHISADAFDAIVKAVAKLIRR